MELLQQGGALGISIISALVAIVSLILNNANKVKLAKIDAEEKIAIVQLQTQYQQAMDKIASLEKLLELNDAVVESLRQNIKVLKQESAAKDEKLMHKSAEIANLVQRILVLEAR